MVTFEVGTVTDIVHAFFSKEGAGSFPVFSKKEARGEIEKILQRGDITAAEKETLAEQIQCSSLPEDSTMTCVEFLPRYLEAKYPGRCLLIVVASRV